MSKKIIYWVQCYQSSYEAISKEIKILHENFNSIVYSPIEKFKLGKGTICYNYRRFPLGLITLPIVELNSKISHIYTSLGNRFYLYLLRKKPIILTGAGASSKDKIKICISKYKKLNAIVVESEIDKTILQNFGIDDSKIFLIYPGIDLSKFSYKDLKNEHFRILFSSAPLMLNQFHSKGVNFLIKASEYLEDCIFVLLWRNKFLEKIKGHIKNKKNIILINKIEKNMNLQYGNVNATVLPQLTYNNSKPCPHSIIESLAAGKPVLVSDVCGIAKLIKKENCGVVFKPTLEEFIKAVEKLKKRYKIYQKNCRITAEKYFSKEKFIYKYSQLYKECLK